MTIMTRKIEIISFTLMLGPKCLGQRRCDKTELPCSLAEGSLSELSVTSMCRYRAVVYRCFRFTECRDVRFLLGEDGQILGNEAKDGEPERHEHCCNHHFG